MLRLPFFVGILGHIFVGQAQGAQGLLCKGLQQPRPSTPDPVLRVSQSHNALTPLDLCPLYFQFMV